MASLKSILGFLLSERTSGVSPVIFSFDRSSNSDSVLSLYIGPQQQQLSEILIMFCDVLGLKRILGFLLSKCTSKVSSAILFIYIKKRPEKFEYLPGANVQISQSTYPKYPKNMTSKQRRTKCSIL